MEFLASSKNGNYECLSSSSWCSILYVQKFQSCVCIVKRGSNTITLFVDYLYNIHLLRSFCFILITFLKKQNTYFWETHYTHFFIYYYFSLLHAESTPPTPEDIDMGGDFGITQQFHNSYITLLIKFNWSVSQFPSQINCLNLLYNPKYCLRKGIVLSMTGFLHILLILRHNNFFILPTKYTYTRNSRWTWSIPLEW